MGKRTSKVGVLVGVRLRGVVGGAGTDDDPVAVELELGVVAGGAAVVGGAGGAHAVGDDRGTRSGVYGFHGFQLVLLQERLRGWGYNFQFLYRNGTFCLRK